MSATKTCTCTPPSLVTTTPAGMDLWEVQMSQGVTAQRDGPHLRFTCDRCGTEVDYADPHMIVLTGPDGLEVSA